MGLTPGPHGVKYLLREGCAEAWREYQKLEDISNKYKASRSQTMAVLDGNVLLKAIPKKVTSFWGILQILRRKVQQAFDAAKHVVIVLDEPLSTTKAKRETQSKRDDDSRRKAPTMSADLQEPIPENDDYLFSDVVDPANTNVRLILAVRNARGRVYDEIMAQLLESFRTPDFKNDGSTLTIDGNEARGGNRPIGSRREPTLTSTNMEMWKDVIQREQPMGEGDLKLPDVCARVYKVESGPLSKIALFVNQTVDMDAIPIELFEEGRRRHRGDDARPQVMVLAIPEPERKKKDELPVDAHIKFVDIAMLYDEIMEIVFGNEPVTAEIGNAAIALLAVGWAACGCDYVKIDGMRADFMLDAVKYAMANRREECLRILQIHSGVKGSTMMALPAIHELFAAYSIVLQGEAKMQISRNKASQYQDQAVLKCLWTAAYWSGTEFKNVTEWGFVPMAPPEAPARAEPEDAPAPQRSKKE